MHKELYFNALLAIFVLLMTPSSLISQLNKENIIYKKYDNIKKKVQDDSLRIVGNLKIHTGLRTYSQSNAKPFEYRINANVQLSYRGLSIPINYTLTNGKSIYRLNGPSVNVPKFSNLGVSPKYKWATFHIGSRNMSFSKYTYENMRFNGGGIELAPDNSLFLKAYYGNLSSNNLNSLNLLNNLDLYKRKSWGTHFGYKKDDNEYSVIIFKATDILESVSDSNIYKLITPKENVAISFIARQKIWDNLSINIDRSITAYTRDLLAPRIAIPTGHTVYNMLGLYEKKESSVYAYASKISLLYKAEQADYSINYEKIDRGYRSLGSLLYDNDFRSYTVSTARPISKKIFLTSEIGYRFDGIKEESPLNNKKLIGSLNLSYQITDRLNTNASYSNFRNTERTYFQSINSLEADSVFLSLVNNQLSLTSNYALNKDKTTNLTVMYSYQNSNRIQSDSISQRFSTRSNIWNINLSMNTEKYSLSTALTTLINNNVGMKMYSIIPNLTLTYNLKDKLRLNNNVAYNYIFSNIFSSHSLIMKNDISYDITKKQKLIFGNKINFSKKEDAFKLFDQIFEMDYTLRF